jgi:hypothetical protein
MAAPLAQAPPLRQAYQNDNVADRLPVNGHPSNYPITPEGSSERLQIINDEKQFTFVFAFHPM